MGDSDKKIPLLEVKDLGKILSVREAGERKQYMPERHLLYCLPGETLDWWERAAAVRPQREE